MQIKALFDPVTSTVTYIVWDAQTKDAVIIDPVLDYDAASSSYDDAPIEELMKVVTEERLKVHYVLETHAHADHLTGAQEIKRRIPSLKIAIGAHISEVQKIFKKIYNLPKDFPVDGSQFDELYDEGEMIEAGRLKFRVIHTPGHTPACSCYLIEDAVFVGDTLFMPDFGVARCDFPGGSAKQLYHSVTKKLYTLPDNTRVFTAHDYQPGGRELRFETTIGESKKSNVHLNATTKEEDFVRFREARDATLSAPQLLLPSIEVNVDAGRFPVPEENGVSYLKIPLRPRK